MSSDLFAAFGEIETPKQPASSSKVPASTNAINVADFAQSDSQLHSAQAVVVDNDDDDDFGDFEDASISPTKALSTSTPSVVKKEPILGKDAKAKPAVRPLPFSPKPVEGPEISKHPFANHMDVLFNMSDEEYDAGEDELNDLATNPEAAMAYSKRVIAEQIARDAVTKTSSSNEKPEQPSTKSTLEKRKAIRDPNVLFDAEDVSEQEENDDDDGWGDFEDSKPSPSTTSAQITSITKSMDLLGLDEPSQPAKTISNSRTIAQTLLSRKAATIVKAQPKAVQLVEDDAWDDFDTSTPESVQTVPSSAQPATLSDASPTIKQTPKPSQDSSPILAPTNVPPPSVLLSIFPSLITSAQGDLFDPLSKLDSASKKHLISHPATHTFLLNYINLGLVLGYIIAGRKSRWKRDQILAQGMRIGPASGSGRSGMKLAGVDKSEITKEDREVLDVVRLWRLHVGKLRSAIALSNANAEGKNARFPAVPEIALQYPVRTLKQSEGGISAPQPCALCGLRRDERVQQQGFEIEDMFDEWWLTGTNMHVLCRRFWEENKKRLKSR